MADTVADEVPEEYLRFNMNPSGIAECLVDMSRKIVPWGIGHVDDKTAISQNLVRHIQPKIMCLEIRFPPTAGRLVKTGNCQGGFIRRDPLAPDGQTYSVHSITAKHNLRRVVDPMGNVHRPSEAFFRLIPNSQVQLVSPDLDWVPTSPADDFDLRAGLEADAAMTHYGFDISVGELLTEAALVPVTRKPFSFSRVRAGFQLKAGQKVGIAVWFPVDGIPTKETITGVGEPKLAMKETKIREIYGEHSCVNIYTGEILFVGEDFIEYSINCFTGCSGAIVFLLDQKQPDTVEECDFGKAVAVHSGPHPSMLDRNVGFIIRRHPLMQFL